MKKGVILLAIGIVGLIWVYSMRPPSGIGDALMMLAQGRNSYLKEPAYLALMSLSGIIALVGLVDIIKASNDDKKK